MFHVFVQQHLDQTHRVFAFSFRPVSAVVEVQLDFGLQITGVIFGVLSLLDSWLPIVMIQNGFEEIGHFSRAIVFVRALGANFHAPCFFLHIGFITCRAALIDGVGSALVIGDIR